MIELASIFLQFLIFLIICSFPLSPKNLNRFMDNKIHVFNYVDCHALNIIIFLNILLFSSFLNINLKITFYLLLVLSLISIIYRRKEIFFLINKKNIIKFLLFFIICISIFISTAQVLKLEWDGFHWILKALNFYNENNIQDLREVKILPEYPHLGGYIWAFFWKNSLLELEYFGRLFYVYLYVVSIFTVYNLLDFKSDKILFLLILTTVLITYDPYLFAGYQEYLIFSILLISARFISLIDFTKKDQKKNIFLNLIILSILIWFKSEGLIYFLIFGSLLVIINKATLKIKFHYFITIFFIVLLQYFLKQYIIGIYESQHSFNIKEFVYLFNNFELLIFKILNISKHLIIGFVKYPLWLITILSLLLIKTKNNKDKEIIKYFIYALVLNLIIIYPIYLNISSSSYDFVLRVTLDRLLFQTSGFYLIIFIYLLNNSKLKKINL
tara:strand:- start:2871 stop:4196 length:1326 start_codon:yes stop_codon:yes gene_type:complete